MEYKITNDDYNKEFSLKLVNNSKNEEKGEKEEKEEKEEQNDSSNYYYCILIIPIGIFIIYILNS